MTTGTKYPATLSAKAWMGAFEVCASSTSFTICAKNGILIKGGRALEASRLIKRIVLDKTGTVTEGKLTVSAVAWAPSHEHGEALVQEAAKVDAASLMGKGADGLTLRSAIISMVAATEARSEHPLAKAVALWGKELTSSEPEAVVDTFESVTGQGVTATLSFIGNPAKYTVYIGNARFVTQSKSSESAYLPSAISSFEYNETIQGRTMIYVSLASSTNTPLPVLAISLADAPKKSSRQAIRVLQKMGVEVCMMTGDGKQTALAIAEQVGIPKENVWAGMSPKGKASVVTELMEKHGEGVAMVCHSLSPLFSLF